MLKYAVIGDPVSHSLSPRMHNAAFRALGMDAEYSAVRVRPEELAAFAERARAELSGFNITVPHKAAIIRHLDAVSASSKLCGSVNTVRNVGGELHGDSTDGYGIEHALKEDFGVSPEGGIFTFIGCGGAARAVSFHLLERGASGLYFANRTVGNAERLVSDLRDAHPGARLSCCALDDLGRLSEFVAESSVVVQTSSVGLNDGDPSPIPEELFLRNACFYDTIYRRTRFLDMAAAKGCRCAGGLSMLLHQGVKSFVIWTGIFPPVEDMRRAIS